MTKVSSMCAAARESRLRRQVETRPHLVTHDRVLGRIVVD
jgi:hypothetical protein